MCSYLKPTSNFLKQHKNALDNMNCTPKVRQKKSNFWGVFIMKLSYEDKVQIYELRKQGYSLEKLSNKFGINNSNLRYMIKLIDRYYSPELKQEMINKVLHEGWTKDRVSLELRNRGFTVNHKKVQRLMKVLGLSARIRRKRKYSSYQGEIGKKAENLIQRQFEASRPMEKCYTDVTEFAIPNSTQKLYLSPVLDGFNSEIIAYNLSCSPNLEQVKAMLERAFTENYYENTVLHSDQGWQYQHDSYHQFLESKGIQPSMSRKGNSPDNGMMESFFGILKSEMFYGYEKHFRSLEDLEQAIVDYIDYYNNKRIKVKLKGLSPVQYRTKSFQ